MRALIGILGLAALTALLAACGSPAPPEPAEITIDMSEYAFAPDTMELRVGQEVTLTLVNVGALEHEILFGRGVVMTNNRPSGYEVDMFELAGVEPVVTMMEMEHADEGEHEHAEEMMAEEGEHEDEHMDHSGFMVHVPVGDATSTMTFTVTEEMVGEWEYGCFLLEGVHYEQGMVGTLTVTR